MKEIYGILYVTEYEMSIDIDTKFFKKKKDAKKYCKKLGITKDSNLKIVKFSVK